MRAVKSAGAHLNCPELAVPVLLGKGRVEMFQMWMPGRVEGSTQICKVGREATVLRGASFTW
jgi:hypothetical protein